MSSIHEEFVSITGSTLEEALTWLEIGQYDLQNAVELFLTSNQHSVTNSSISHHQSSASDQNDIYETDSVRLPDSVKRGRLVDEAFLISNKVPRPAVRSAFSSGSSFVPKNDKEKTLSDIYKAPLDLMTIDSFDGVLEMSKSRDQWLLINLQRDSEFQCHLLNRDFWSDESVRDMVLSSFVFWQQSETAEEGAKYVERYKVSQFPHISIIDPRTGASVWRHDGDFNRATLAEKLQDFLGAQSVPSESSIASRMMRKLTANTSSTSSSSASQMSALARTETRIEGESSEEADLEEAIRLSMQQQQSDEGTTEHAASKSVIKQAVEEVVVPALEGFSVSELNQLAITDTESDESPPIKTVFRLPAGGKVMHTFASTTPLRDLAVFAAQQIVASDASAASASSGLRFDVSYNFPQVLLSKVADFDAQSLSSAGIPTGTAFVLKML